MTREKSSRDLAKAVGIPPSSPSALSSLRNLAQNLAPLLGQRHSLSGESRAIGSDLRKLVSRTLLATLPAPATDSSYRFSTPPRKKGIVSIRREWLDTYMVTTDTRTYNLQVWNRDPLAEIPQVIYDTGETLAPIDVRYALIKIDRTSELICSIALMTPDHISSKYGPFGKPTVKYQARIPSSLMPQIQAARGRILTDTDTERMMSYTRIAWGPTTRSFRDAPVNGELFDIRTIADRIKTLVGTQLPAAATKVRGQALEMLVAKALGYSPVTSQLGMGGYPDIPNQALEVKVQEAGMVDIGEHTTTVDEEIFSSPLLSTRDIRYCLAITNESTLEIDGFLLVPGATLENHLKYVGETSFKKQRAIRNDVFAQNLGKITINS